MHRVEALNAELITARLSRETMAWLRDLQIYDEIDSTNTYLMSRARTGRVDGCVCLAERQTRGRGRRGRTWLSPEGGGIALSVGRGVAVAAAAIAPLSLVVGLAVADALNQMEVRGVSLKWPNDVLLDGAKVGGVLVELARLSNPLELVVGIGLNVGCGKELTDQLMLPVGDLAAHGEISRNRLVSEVLNALHERITLFESGGFGSMRDEWDRLDAYRGCLVTLRGPSEGIEGIVQGVAETGELILETRDGSRRFNAGEMTLRAHP